MRRTRLLAERRIAAGQVQASREYRDRARKMASSIRREGNAALIRLPQQLALLLLSFVVFPSFLSAQAWLFPKGEGTVSLSFQNLYVRDHAFSKGEADDRGQIFSHVLTTDVDYSLTGRLAARIALPYVAGKYSGLRPHQIPIDNGTYHSTFQDVRVNLRYNLSKRPAVITPFFEAVIPTHRYESFGHSAVGRDQREYRVGANFGRGLGPVLPKAYLQARYSYAVVERILGIAPNRSDTEFQFGYFLTPRFSFLGLGSWQHTHSGLDFPIGLFHGGLPDDQYRHHDQIGKASLLDVGGGAGFALSRSLHIFVSVVRSLRGRNAHLHAAVFTVGLSRSFGTRFEADSAPFVEGAPAPN